MHLLDDWAIPLLGMCSRKMHTCVCQISYSKYSYSTICKNPKLESVQMLISNKVRNCGIFPQQSTISNENEWCTTAYNTDESHKYYVKLNKRNQTVKSTCFMIPLNEKQKLAKLTKLLDTLGRCLRKRVGGRLWYCHV